MAQPVFETLASLLLDVRPTALEGEAKEAWDDTTVGALYWLLPPSYPPLLQTAGTLASSALKRFLYLHCNSARPEAVALEGGFAAVVRRPLEHPCRRADASSSSLRRRQVLAASLRGPRA